MNNDFVSGFDDVLDKHLSIKLETLDEISDYLVAHFKGYIDLSNHEFAHEKVKKIIDAGFVRLIIDCNAL
jgi:anti-anti-sigma regulatory factor